MVLQSRCLAGDRPRAVHRVQAVRPRRDARATRSATPTSWRRCAAKRIKSVTLQESAGGGTEIIARHQRRQAAAQHGHLPRPRPGRRPASTAASSSTSSRARSRRC
ncbi:MAG: hypothetical protein MZW92_25870 [Comamonadaceae bacterium]|nr:hypothetical protein [Comamonadaceae bacterium]